MKKEKPLLVVAEHLNPLYLNGTILSFITALILLLSYYQTGGVFTSSVLQFSSFAFFAFGFYTFYKALDEKITLEIFQNRDGLRVDFIQSDRLVSQEHISKNDHISIQETKGLIQWNTYRITFPDNDFLKNQNRSLFLTSEKAQLLRSTLHTPNK